jgi:hypothetical protein
LVSDRSLLRAAAACACLIAAGCAGSAPVTPEQVAQAERRLLLPLLHDAEVGCGELLVEVTANFYPNVSQPGIDERLHGVRREETPEYIETIWLNRLGDLGGAFTVVVGETDTFSEQGVVRGRGTKFTVLHEVRVRVYQGTRPMTLAIEAKGRPLVYKEGEQVRDLAEFRLADGVLQAR